MGTEFPVKSGLALLLCIASDLWASTVKFDELAQKLLEKNPAMLIDQLEIQRQIVSQKAATWELSPSLSLGSDRTFRRAAVDGRRTETSTDVRASLNVFIEFASWKKIDIADRSAAKARSDQALTRRQILAQLANSYRFWQQSYQKLALVANLSRIRESMLKSIEVTVRTGERSKTDQLLFENLLLQAQERASRTEIDLRQAIIAIQKSLSEILTEFSPQTQPQDEIVFSRDYCDQEPHFLDHPSIKSLDDQTKLDSLQWEAAAAGYYPYVDLSFVKNLDQFSTRSTQHEESIQLSFTWPLFTGLSTRYDRMQLGFQIQKTEIRRSDAYNELILTHQENCTRLQAVDDWYFKAGKIAENYKEILNTARLQHRNGGISSLDLTDQELRLLDAELSLIDARFAKQEILASQWVLHDATF